MNTFTEALQEIMYRNWKNEDEVGLYTEVSKLFKEYKEYLISSLEEMKQEKMLGKDQHGTELYKAGTRDIYFAQALDAIITKIKEE